MYTWTREQEDIFSAATDPSIELLKIEARAGSSKTTSLVEASKRMQDKKLLYMSFSKAMITEIENEFPDNVECRTIHSMAYRHTVKQYGLRVTSGFYPRDMDKSIPYKERQEIAACLDDYCLSGIAQFDDYVETNNVQVSTAIYVKGYLEQMFTGELGCSHSFYLKLFHTLMNDGTIVPKKVDVLMIDEVQDLTDLTVEIFRLYPATKKIMVGDPHQSIYSFMNCSNAFEYFKDEGTTRTLSQTFRVSKPIAKRVERYMRDKLDHSFSFNGMEYPAGKEIETKVYIALTNSGLVEEMLRMQHEGVAFHTTRKIEEILELPLILANIGNGKPIKNIKYKALEGMRKHWEMKSKYNDTSFLHEYHSPIRYVMSLMKDDIEIETGYKVVLKYGPAPINNLLRYAKECIKVDTGLCLSTGHSSKGLTFDMAEIAPDFNQKMDEAEVKLKEARSTGRTKDIKKIEELYRLYYVACTRCRVRLINAKHLPECTIIVN